MKNNKLFKIVLTTLLLTSALVSPLLISVGKAQASGTPPGIVTDFNVEYQVTPDVIHVSWGVPTDPGSSPVTGYKLAWSIHSANDYSSPISTNATHYDLSTSNGLTKDKLYDIKVWAANSDGEGEYDLIPYVLYGVQVYDITNCQQLQNMNNDLEGDYTLANDFSCAVTEDWDGGFAPIGGTDFMSGGFTGTFDGQGHTISNLYIGRSDESVVGLFGAIFGPDSQATVSNFNLTNCEISGGTFTGAVAGILAGDATISDIQSHCTVVGANDPEGGFGEFSGVGGLVGAIFGGGSESTIVTRSSTSGEVVIVIPEDGFNIGGGLVGLMMDGAALTDSYSTAHVISNNEGGIYLAGAVGGALTFFDGPMPIIKNIYVTGNVTMREGNLPGGLIGLVSSADVENNFVSNLLTFDGDTGPGFLIGQVTTQDEDNIILNNFADAGGSGVSFCMGGDPSIHDECTFVNTEEEPDANYFKSNSIKEPMHSWDFDTIWSTVDGSFPVLDYRPTDDSGGATGGSSGSGSSLKAIKKKLTSSKLNLANLITQAPKAQNIKLNDFDDYVDGSGHELNSLMIGQVIHFDILVNGKIEHHSITIKEIGDGYIIVTIASKPHDLRINLNQLMSVSVDGQSVMTIELTGIFGSSANLKLAKINSEAKTTSSSGQSYVATAQLAKPSSSKNLTVAVVAAIIFVFAAIYLAERSRYHSGK